MNLFYYVTDAAGEVKGPYAESQLRTMWDAGSLTADAQVCLKGEQDWQPISDVLEAIPSPIAAPIKTPAQRAAEMQMRALIAALGDTLLDHAETAKAPVAQKPLFIPLKTAFFRAFKEGTKTSELRKYGPRWNERTCYPGRPVVLSHGYSGERIKGVIVGFERSLAECLNRDWLACYGPPKLDESAAVIRLSL